MKEPIALLELEPLQNLSRHLRRLVRGRLWLQVLVGLVLGVAVGIALGPESALISPAASEITVCWLAFPGMLFLALIQMIVVPLVFCSIIRGLGASDSMAHLRALGFRAALYYVATSAIAIVIGLTVALVVQPGRFIDAALLQEALDAPGVIDQPKGASFELAHLPMRLVELVPSNPLAAMVGGDMLGVVVVAIIVGIAMVSMRARSSAALFDLLGGIQEVCMIIVKWAMWLAPIAVFGLITQVTSKVGWDALAGLGVYVATVLGGLLLLAGVYALIVGVLTRTGVSAFFRAAREAQLLAFSTSSSAAVMPLSMKTAEERLGVSAASARFLIPLGATVNMDGTALYQGVATVFLAQAFGIDLSATALALVVLTAVAASIGSPATPGVGIVILSMVLTSAGVPTAGVALILGVDRIVDMSRTAVNVTGDLTACLVLDRWLERAEPQLAPEAGGAGL